MQNKDKKYEQPTTSAGFVACTPIPKRETSGGSIKDSIVKLDELIELTVVFGNSKLLNATPGRDVSVPGDKVFVKTPTPGEPWAKSIYTLCLGDVCHRFILVPEACILLRRSEYRPLPVLGSDYFLGNAPEGYAHTGSPYLPFVPAK